jgi:hypothetical protein
MSSSTPRTGAIRSSKPAPTSWSWRHFYLGSASSTQVPHEYVNAATTNFRLDAGLVRTKVELLS